MAYYDESDDSWEDYGSWDYDDVNDEYWYDEDDDYDDDNEDHYDYDDDEEEDDDDDDEDDDDDDDPWNNALDHQGECDIIAETMTMYKIVVKNSFPQKLKYFTVRGEGLFECKSCNNRWTSHNATIKVDLIQKCVSRKFTQRCKYCSNQWATPFFTDDRFEEIMDKVADKFKSRVEGDDSNCQPTVLLAAGNGKPHPQEHCEKCQLLKKPCWKYVINAV